MEVCQRRRILGIRFSGLKIMARGRVSVRKDMLEIDKGEGKGVREERV